MPQEMPKLMTQKEALEKLKAEFPELGAWDGNLLMEQIFKRRPDLINKIENPRSGDAAARVAQNNALKDKDKNTLFTRRVLDGLPMLGGAAGAAMGGMETFGTGIPWGMATGAGAGRGLRDVITQMLGIENTTPMEKAGRIGLDTAIAGMTPGAVDTLTHPRNTIGSMLEDFTPPWMSKLLKPPILKKIFPTTQYTRPNIPSEGMQFPPDEGPIIRTPPSTPTGTQAPLPNGLPVTAERPVTTTGSTFQFKPPPPPTVGPRIRIADQWNPKATPEVGPSTVQWVRNAKGEWVMKTGLPEE